MLEGSLSSGYTAEQIFTGPLWGVSPLVWLVISVMTVLFIAISLVIVRANKKVRLSILTAGLLVLAGSMSTFTVNEEPMLAMHASVKEVTDLDTRGINLVSIPVAQRSTPTPVAFKAADGETVTAMVSFDSNTGKATVTVVKD